MTEGHRVAVLEGGRSLERQVSLRSGARVRDALERLGHEVVAIDVGHDLVERLIDLRPGVAFIALHGREGEDGTVQELLEVLDIPYTGSGVAACARCADKVVTKQLVREGTDPIATPDFVAFSETAFKELGAAAALPQIERLLGFPLVVKPAGQGSALGIRFARTAAEVAPALVAAFSYGDKVLLERHVEGRDLAVGVIETKAGVRALPVVEAVPVGEDPYDYEARYEIGRTEFVCPAELPAGAAQRAADLALAAWARLGCAGFARVDFMLGAQDEELALLEVNAVPGLTATSLLPMAAEAAGVGFDELIAGIVASAAWRLSAAGDGA